MRKKNYEELELRDDFMFGKVMGNKELCKEVLETLLVIRIDSIEYPEQQKSIRITSEGRGVRLDVYVQDEKDTIYDAEMQQGTPASQTGAELPLRSRYYQGMIDLNLLERGVSYQELKECYIIFICTFDPFGEGRYRYTFRNTCQENKERTLDDKSIRVFFNTGGAGADESEELRELLHYLVTKECRNELTRKLDREVEQARHNEKWRREYMKTLLHDMEMKEEGHAEGLQEGLQVGHEEGLQEGLQMGKSRMNRLIIKLAELGRTEDLVKAATDAEYQEKLFKEFDI